MPSTYVFDPPLREGVIVSRPNRFVMIVRAKGRVLRCHCPSTGRLGDLELAGLPCLYSRAKNPGRKTAHTVEAIGTAGKRPGWIGINQTAVNRYVEHFLRAGRLAEIARGEVKREVRLGRSRIDFLVGDTYLETKMPLISLPTTESARRVSPRRFDSFDRLIRHMGELKAVLSKGKRAVIAVCFVYDAGRFNPPREAGASSKVMRAAQAAERSGVQTWQLNLRIDPNGVRLSDYFRLHLFT